MAPTVSELSDCRAPIFLDEELMKILRISTYNEGIRHRSQNKPIRLSKSKVFTLMGLVVDQAVREGDSPGLPSSNTSIDIDRRSPEYSKKQDLINITIRTMALLQRNQILQKRLNKLQNETKDFVRMNSQQNGHSVSIDK